MADTNPELDRALETIARLGNPPDRFTLVFEGDITKFKGNPLKTETPFGIPFAASIGDALEKIEHLIEVEEAAENLLNVIRRA